MKKNQHSKKITPNNINKVKDCPVLLPDENLKFFNLMKSEIKKNKK